MLYARYLKRIFDFAASLCALIVLSPLMLILIVVGAIQMGGNPFFTQERPGKDGKIFRLIKFRSMNNKKDAAGNLLPDMERMTKYGRFIRSASLDELPQLINIVRGEMSFIGPRPLLVEYLPLYSKEQLRRHEVLPGISGWAQVNGRNEISWKQKFERDVWYVENISFALDMKILVMTVVNVLRRQGINAGVNETMEKFKGE